MKASNYNFFFSLDDKGNYLAYNALKNSLIVFPEPLVDLLQSMTRGASLEMVEEDSIIKLKQGGFICEDSFDEYGLIQVRHNLQQYSGTDTLGLTVVPSSLCNLFCSYCFESPDNHRMDQNVINNLVEFVEKRIEQGLKRFSVLWFGGEPTLCMDIIETLSQKWLSLCEKNNIKYDAYIVTNGTLYTRELAEKLKALQVTGAQITIDGDKEHHDARRPYRGGSGSFDQIFANVIDSAGVLPISLRVNVDRKNIDSALEFLKNLQANPRLERFFKKGDIRIHYGHVRKFTASCRCSDEECLQASEFWQEEFKLRQYLHEKGISPIPFPSMGSGCTATTVNGYVVGPQGEMYKCWNHIGNAEKVIGHINEEIKIDALYISYLTENFEKDEKCQSCKVLPLCLGGCVDIRINYKNGSFPTLDCSKWQEYLEKSLKAYYLMSLKVPPVSG